MVDTWRYLQDDAVTATEGLAVDEALMASVQREVTGPRPALRLYTYASHAALVGRYQTLDAEVDLAACAATGTGVSRRPTGGGAIVMGADQLGVALVLPAGPTSPRELIAELGTGVVEGLRSLGVQAGFGGKNDLLVGGRKIAGLGLYLDPHGALLFHASLLVDLDVAFMLTVLRIPAAKLADQAEPAVRARVTTVREQLGGQVTVDRVRDAVATGFAARFGARLEPDRPTDRESQAAAELVRTRYAAAEWLHRESARPDGTGSAAFRSPEGLVRVYVAAQGSLAKSLLFTGDFNTLPAGLVELESGLRWCRLDPATVRERVAAARRSCPGDLGWRDDEDVVSAVLDAGSRAAGRDRAHPVRPAGSCYFPDPSTRSVR
jgi:lipoate-protein ligase A